MKNFKRTIKDTIWELEAYFGKEKTSEHILPYLANTEEEVLAVELAAFYRLQEFASQMSMHYQ